MNRAKKKKKETVPAGRLSYTPTAIGVNYIELEGNLMGTASIKLNSTVQQEAWEDGGDISSDVYIGTYPWH
ncbi:MAG: hypothetical protein LBR48_09650 [Dysgonamonadaceae bacterium]|jgi:hypothetical protein|nr:hypothetical protein [Dysgonamonadaceae bacterium]